MQMRIGCSIEKASSEEHDEHETDAQRKKYEFKEFLLSSFFVNICSYDFGGFRFVDMLGFWAISDRPRPHWSQEEGAGAIVR